MSANRLLLTGDLAGSEQAVHRLAGLGVTAGSGLAAVVEPRTWAEPHLLALRHWQGRLGELRDEVGGYGALGAAAAAARTCALAHAGLLAEAGLDLDRWTAEGFGNFPEDLTWLSAMVLVAETALVAGHAGAARAAADLLGPYAGRLDNYGDGSLSSVDLALAQTALVAPPPGAGAGQAAAAAVASCRRAGAPVLLGRALVCLAAAGGGTRALLDEALGIAGRTGAAIIDQDAARFGLR